MRPLLFILLPALAILTVHGEPADQLPGVHQPDPLPAAARQVMNRYSQAVAEAQKARDAAVLKAAEATRKELVKIQEQETKAGRLEPALAVKAQVDKLPEKQEVGEPTSELLVQARIDGSMELHLTPAGLYWKWVGTPGSSHVTSDPVYVNGQPWQPKWDSPDGGGAMKSELFPVRVGPVEQLKVELVALGMTRATTGIEHRDPIRSEVKSREFVVTIPDSQPGACWYTMKIRGAQPTQ